MSTPADAIPLCAICDHIEAVHIQFHSRHAFVARRVAADALRRQIVAQYDPPPIPIRTHDWRAYDAATCDERGPVGYGRTREAAIADLLEQLGEPAEETCALLREQAE